MSDPMSLVANLSPAEKLQLIGELWDDLSRSPSNVPLHDWQKDDLDRRAANLLANPDSAITWQEVKRRIRNRHGR